MRNIFRVICAVLAMAFVACEEPYTPVAPDNTIASLGTPANNEIWFTTTDEQELITLDDTAFNTPITDIEYIEYGISTIRFAEALTIVGDGAFDNCRNLKNISLPESVTSIGERAFFECTNLECMTLGSKIRSCGNLAFDNCVELYSLHIPSVGEWCKIEFADPRANPLYFCNQLIENGKKVTEIIIPSWVSRIGDYAFYNYTTMSAIKISAKVQSIGKNAFEGCERLSKVDIEDLSAWCKIDFATVNSNPLSIAGTLLINGYSATNLSFEGIESISPLAFMGCNNTISVRSDSSLRIVGEEAFRGSIGLSQVEIGDGVTEIRGRAFMGCSALKSVKCHAIVPPALGDKYVFDYNATDRKIYVPAESVDDYKDHEAWSRYADAIMAMQ